MARRPRTVFPGVAHHITQRGNNRQPVFFSNDGRRFYLLLLSRNAARHGVHILGYCLMTNHIHLVAVPEDALGLSHMLGRVQSEYSQAFNHIEGRSGHLWQSRFFSCPLDERHLVNALRYVDLNPLRAGIAIHACDFPWSSAAAHSSEEAGDPWLDRNWPDYTGGWDYAGWGECLDTCAADSFADSLLRRATLAGEPLGSADFVEELERRAGRRLRALANGRPKKPPAQTGAAQGLLLAAG